MTEDIDLPESLFGIHPTSPERIPEIAREVLEHNIPINPRGRQDIEFQNAPDFHLVEDSANYRLTLYVPLPFLHHADADTDDLKAVLGPLITRDVIPAAVEFTVEVHPGSEQI